MAKTIMIVNDDSGSNVVLRAVLEEGGYVVLVARTQDEALLKMGSEVDLILIEALSPREKILDAVKDVGIAYLITKNTLSTDGVRMRML